MPNLPKLLNTNNERIFRPDTAMRTTAPRGSLQQSAITPSDNGASLFCDVFSDNLSAIFLLTRQVVFAYKCVTCSGYRQNLVP